MKPMKMWIPRTQGLITVPLVFIAGATFQSSTVTLVLAIVEVLLCATIIWNVASISRNIGSINANLETLRQLSRHDTQ